MKISSKTIAGIGVSAALYVALTLLCAPLSYGQVQFRFSEMMILLCYFSKDHIVSMTLGCVIVNLFSPLGLADVLFGTSATLAAAVLIYLTRRKLPLAAVSLFPVVTNGLIVGAELTVIFAEAPFWVNAGFVALGEFVCVTVVGVITMRLLMKSSAFMGLVSDEKTVGKEQ